MRGIVATIFFVLFVNLFLYHSIGSLGATIFFVGLLLFINVVHRDKRAFRKKPTLVIGIIALIFSLLISFRASGVAQAVLVWATLLALGAFTYLTASDGAFFRNLSEFVFVPFHLLGPYLTGAITAWKRAAASQKDAGRRVRSLVVGLAVGLPVAFVLLGLLSQADPVFAYMTRSLFSEGVFQRIVVRIVVSSAVFVFLLPVVYLAIRRPTVSLLNRLTRGSWSSEMAVVSSVVALVLGVFLVVQAPYVFANVARETDLTRFGVATYSEYVKRGFVEFVVTSAMLYGIVWGGLLALRGKETKKMALRIAQALLIGEFGVFILSIFRRVWLYIQFHGLSLSRVYGTFVLVAVTMLFVTLALRHWKPRIHWVRMEAIGLTVIVFLFGLINVEQLVSEWRPPTVNGRVDHMYLSRLSSDGYAGWKKAYGYARDVLTEKKYAETGGISERDREAIDYAGIILMQLTRRYHGFMMQYGSLEEQRQYASRLLSFQKEMIEEILPGISKKAREDEAKGIREGQSTYAEEALNGEYRWVVERLSQSSTDPFDTLSRVGVGYVSLQYYLPAGIPTTFYTIARDANVPARRMDMLSRLYVWNTSKKAAFSRMKYDMPLVALLSLQRAYVRLAGRIAGQSESEQGYRPDVSFEGPFLAPL